MADRRVSIIIAGRRSRATCAVCAASLAGKRADATTCSATCRSALRRRKHEQPAHPRRLRGYVEPPEELWRPTERSFDE